MLHQVALRFNKLTRPAIRALPIGETITEHGIAVERQKNGDLRYTINIMVDGERIHRVIGRESDGTTREQAERAVEAIRTRAREDRLDLPTGRKTHRTFIEAAEQYLERIEHHPKHGRNFSRKRQHIRGRLSPYFKAQRLDKLTDFSISHYVRDRKGEGAAVATINRELSTLSHLLNRAVDWGWIRKRPKIDKGHEDRKQIVVLGKAEQAALLQAGVEDQDPYAWLFVAIAMGTAMRHSEVLSIRWGQIDFDQRRIFVPRAKAGYREQPMPSSLADRLRTHWEQLGSPDGWIFPTKRADAKHVHRQDMAQQFRRVVKRAGLDPKKVTPHVLRHTAITSLVQAGVDLPTVQKVSGHKTLAMVLRYTHISDAHVDKAISTLKIELPANDSSSESARIAALAANS